MTQIKAGQEVTITIKGRVNTVYGQKYDLDKADCISIELENGNNIGLEADGYLSELQIEVIHELPTEEGWYEAERYPISDPAKAPYRLIGGEWSCLNTALSDNYMRSLLPLHRLGRTQE